MEHQITRHRHELKGWLLTVKEKTRITPEMIRIVFEGDALANFTSLAPDDHVKLLIPAGEDEPERRDARTLTIDFAIHEAGPATRWALKAEPGDALTVSGPRGSAVVPPTFDWWLLVGDETALPAIGRRVEELPRTAQVISLVAVTSVEARQSFETAAQHRPLWVHRPAGRADDPEPLLSALQKVRLPGGDGFVWIAAEARVARAVRDHLLTALRAERRRRRGRTTGDLMPRLAAADRTRPGSW
jgi:NADPH-dependent ferric siderophore reductase